MTDDLEDLLGSDGVELADMCREALLAQTIGVLRRRAALRRAARTAAVLALFPLGVLAGWQLTPASVVEYVIVEKEATSPPVVPAPSRVLSPNELEQQAELSDDPAVVAQRYREAGDRYLSEHADYAEAARCYRLSLSAVADRNVGPDDSWLLISMKASPR